MDIETFVSTLSPVTVALSIVMKKEMTDRMVVAIVSAKCVFGLPYDSNFFFFQGANVPER